MANTAARVAATTSSERIACFIGDLLHLPAYRNAAASPLRPILPRRTRPDNLTGQVLRHSETSSKTAPRVLASGLCVICRFRALQELAIEPVDVVDQALDRVARQHALAARAPHPLAELRVVGEPGQALGELLRRARFDEETVLALLDDVRHTPDPSRDDGAARGERLDCAHRRA